MLAQNGRKHQALTQAAEKNTHSICKSQNPKRSVSLSGHANKKNTKYRNICQSYIGISSMERTVYSNVYRYIYIYNIYYIYKTPVQFIFFSPSQEGENAQLASPIFAVASSPSHASKRRPEVQQMSHVVAPNMAPCPKNWHYKLKTV